MSERDDIAKSFHNIYLVTAKVFGWPVRPEVDVPFERFSKDAQELDYALADFHLAKIARLREENESLRRSYNGAVAEVATLLSGAGVMETEGDVIREARALLEEKERFYMMYDYSQRELGKIESRLAQARELLAPHTDHRGCGDHEDRHCEAIDKALHALEEPK